MPGKVRLAQHFLADDGVADRIIEAAEINHGEHVVEIGPGHGMLTRRLLEWGARVASVELDSRLSAELAERFKGDAGFTIHNADFLKFDLSTLPCPAKIVANLPYAVGTPILQRLLDWPHWRVAVLMFQKEVAERIVAGGGDRKFGILSLSVALKAEAFQVCAAGRRCFSPSPKVDSAVVRLDRRPAPLLPEGLSEDQFFRVVRAAFAQRRKMAANSLASGLGLPRLEVEAAMARVGLAEGVRAEDIPLEAFLSLARGLPVLPGVI